MTVRPLRRWISAGLLVLAAAPGIQAQQGSRGASASPLAAEIDKLAAAIEPEMLEWRRYLHQHPELSNRETETSKYVDDANLSGWLPG